MQIRDIYQLAIQMGKESDPRGLATVDTLLAERQQDYQQLSEQEKADFDQDSLENPYPDSRILWGDATRPVKHVFVGIDIGPAELMIVDRLNQKGAGIDLVMAHHPEGLALTTLHHAMDLQTDIFACCGVHVNVAEQILQGEAHKTANDIVVGNYNRTVDAARLLELPLICVHTPADNLVQKFWQDRFDQAQPKKVSQILKLLESEAEYTAAKHYQAGPRLLAGSENNRTGRIMVDMTGGTDAGPKLYEKLGPAGIGTVVAMHMSEGTLDVLSKEHINVILAGHMSSDSLGLNLFLDQLELRGIQVTAGSGLTRFSRLESHAESLNQR